MSLWSRRKFFLTSLASGAAVGAGNLLGDVTPANATLAKSDRNRSGGAAGSGR